MSVAAAMAFLSKVMTTSSCSRARSARAVTGTAAATPYPIAGRRRRQRPGAADRTETSADADNQRLREDAGGEAVLLTLRVAVDLRLDRGARGHPDRRRRHPHDLAMTTPVAAGEVGGHCAPAERSLRGEDDAVEDSVVELCVGHQLDVALKLAAVAD